MTSEEIKRLPVIGISTKLDGFPVDDAKATLFVQLNCLVKEIAYQLAVMNEWYEGKS